MSDRRDQREEEEARQVADDLETDAERMDQRAEELDRDIEGTKQDWKTKRDDASVPGAQDPAAVRDDVSDDDEEESEVTSIGEAEEESEPPDQAA